MRTRCMKCRAIPLRDRARGKQAPASPRAQTGDGQSRRSATETFGPFLMV
jgi:hypothetical protein